MGVCNVVRFNEGEIDSIVAGENQRDSRVEILTKSRAFFLRDDPCK